MAEKLKNFLSELAVDAEKLASYLKDPDAVMKAAGLDADECAALKSGDSAKVYESLSGQSSTVAAEGSCIWATEPRTDCIWATQPPADCIWAAQPTTTTETPAAPGPQTPEPDKGTKGTT